MQTIPMERRSRRSYHPQQALSYQLDNVRDRTRLDALVLATTDGLSIAYSGEDDLCLELAALAPFLDATPANDAEPRTMHVRTLVHADVPLLLVSYGEKNDPELEAWLDHASQGIARILAD